MSRSSFPLLNKWVVGWLSISTVVVLWDAMFVLLRPDSMPGGSLSFLWPGYDLYIAVDRSYADVDNTTVEALCMVSILEAFLVCGALWKHALKKGLEAHLFTLVVTSLTCAKTILFFMMELFSGFHHVGHAGFGILVLVYILPNILWVVVPGLIAVKSARKIVRHS